MGTPREHTMAVETTPRLRSHTVRSRRAGRHHERIRSLTNADSAYAATLPYGRGSDWVTGCATSMSRTVAGRRSAAACKRDFRARGSVDSHMAHSVVRRIVFAGLFALAAVGLGADELDDRIQRVEQGLRSAAKAGAEAPVKWGIAD